VAEQDEQVLLMKRLETVQAQNIAFVPDLQQLYKNDLKQSEYVKARRIVVCV
jgi:hypothetical protein